MPNQQISPEQFDVLHSHYLANPDQFVVEVLGAEPWALQVDIIKSTFKYKITAVKTCNAIGKSFIAARVVLAYLMLHPNSIVVTTAPTWRQVTDILWREIGTALKQSKYKLTDKEAVQAGLTIDTNWYAVGLSTKRPENFFGYHADHILVVVDEAGGVEEPIFRGVSAITPNINARVLLIGNPTNPSGTFFDYFNKPELGANCITVSAFDSPNFTACGIRNVDDLLTLFTPRNDVPQSEWTKRINEELAKRMNPVYASLIDPSVVYGRYHEWGTDSPAWQALIMGEFPTEAEQALIPTNLVIQAQNMSGIDEDSGKTFAELSGWNIPDGAPEYGQDMARYGNDSSVCIPRHGGWVEKPIAWGKTSLMESADRILKIIDPLDYNTRVNIDDTGNGGGTTDRLRQIGGIEQREKGSPVHQYQLAAYNFSSKEFMDENDRKKYHDITSMLYWNLRRQFLKHQIAIPKHQRLFDELVGRRWFLNKSGKIQVESKDDYKKRTGGKSPDYSDALALAFAGGMRKPRSRALERQEYDDETAIKPFTSGITQRGW